MLLQIHLQAFSGSLNQVLLTSLLHLLSHMPHDKDPVWVQCPTFRALANIITPCHIMHAA
jgi:hypothetical protein